MKTKNQVDWHRLEKSLIQYERKGSRVRNSKETISVINKWADHLGEASLARAMIYKIGLVLMDCEKPKVLVPVCPDYTHTNGKYDFRGINGGISLLAHKQEEFLEKIGAATPLEIHFLIADQESEDRRIAEAIGKTQSEFREMIESSVEAMARRFSPKGWNSGKMTSFAPDLASLETLLKKELSTGEQMDRIRLDTLLRGVMYNKICDTMAHEERVNRTLRTAAQYLALGTIAAKRTALIANHTTVNLRYYSLCGAALLHNPVSVY